MLLSFTREENLYSLKKLTNKSENIFNFVTGSVGEA